MKKPTKNQDVFFALFISIGGERGGGEKVSFLLQRAFLKSGDLLSLYIMEKHSCGFHDSLNSRQCV